MEERAAPKWVRERIWLKADLVNPKAVAYEIHRQILRRIDKKDRLRLPWHSSVTFDDFITILVRLESGEEWDEDEEKEPVDNLDKIFDICRNYPNVSIAEYLRDRILVEGENVSPTLVYGLWLIGPRAAQYIADVLTSEDDKVVEAMYGYYEEISASGKSAGSIFFEIRDFRTRHGMSPPSRKYIWHSPSWR